MNKVIDDIRNSLKEKEEKLEDLNVVSNSIHDEKLRVEQTIAQLEQALRHHKEKVPYCPSCGHKCCPYSKIVFRCLNRNCEDYLTEWVWDDEYHSRLMRH